MRSTKARAPQHEVYHGERDGSQDPYSRSPVPRLPFRLRSRLIPSNPTTKRPWRYAEVGGDAVLYSQLGPTTEDMIAHWRHVLPPSQWMVRTGRLEGVDDGLALVVLDIDRPDHAPAKPLGAWQVQTRRGFHWYTWTEQEIASTRTEWGDVKASGLPVMAPRSRHPDTGVPYTPLEGFGKLVDGQLPLLPPEYLPEKAVQTPVELPEGVGTSGTIPPPVRAKQGERWLTLRGLLSRAAGSPGRRGDEGQLLALGRWYNEHFSPPMDTDRVVRLARDIAEASRTWTHTEGFIETQAQRGRQSGRVRQPRTQERNAAIRAARAQGLSVPGTAELFGVSRSTVIRACGHG